MTPKQKHEIISIALGYARCSCGHEYRVESYKGKTDEDLSFEVLGEFEDHKKKNA